MDGVETLSTIVIHMENSMILDDINILLSILNLDAPIYLFLTL